MITAIASCVALEIDMAADVALKFPSRPETVSRPGVIPIHETGDDESGAAGANV